MRKLTIQSLCGRFLEGTIGPVIEVQIVKNLDHFGLEIANPSPIDSTLTSCVLISRGKSRFVDEVHIPMPNSDPVQNCSLNLRKQRMRTLLGTVEDKHPGDWCGHV